MIKYSQIDNGIGKDTIIERLKYQIVLIFFADIEKTSNK